MGAHTRFLFDALPLVITVQMFSESCTEFHMPNIVKQHVYNRSCPAGVVFGGDHLTELVKSGVKCGNIHNIQCIRLYVELASRHSPEHRSFLQLHLDHISDYA